MSMHLTSGIARRVGSLATAGIVALSGAVVLAPTAAADDYERTPDEVIERIEALPWPVYSIDQPGPSPDIRFAQYFLDELGYPINSPGTLFGEETEELIINFDADHELTDDATLESQTWVKIRNLHFPTEQDAYQVGDQGQAVRGIHYILNEKFSEELPVEDDEYTQDTADAVARAQAASGIREDGAFGRLTYKCSITKPEVAIPEQECLDEGGASAEAPAEAPAEEGGTAEAPAEEADGSRGY